MASFTQYPRWAHNLNPQNILIFLRFKLSTRRACPAAPWRGSWAIPPWREYHFWMDTNLRLDNKHKDKVMFFSVQQIHNINGMTNFNTISAVKVRNSVYACFIIIDKKNNSIIR
jgi:hypothetical protein